jgi:Putative prokaryotic signal transducing protein
MLCNGTIQSNGIRTMVDVTEASLAAQYAELPDETLLQRIQSGTLTDMAFKVMSAELSKRGLAYVEPQAEPEPLPMDSDHDDRWSNLEQYLSPIEAEVLCGLLNSEGVPAQVADIHLMTALPMWQTAAYGGVRVRVPTAFLQRAMEIKAAFVAGAYADLEAESTPPVAPRT